MRRARSARQSARRSSTSSSPSSTRARARAMPRASATATRSSTMADIAAPLRRWSYASVSDKIADIVLRRPSHWVWFAAFGIASLGTVAFVGAIGWLFLRGIGIWGVNIPTAWGFAIANFVWWIGIGHA